MIDKQTKETADSLCKALVKFSNSKTIARVPTTVQA